MSGLLAMAIGIGCASPNEYEPPPEPPKTYGLSAEKLAEFRPICEDAVRCDPQMQSFPDPIDICMGVLARQHKKSAADSARTRACLRQQSCVEQDFPACVPGLKRRMGISWSPTDSPAGS